MSFQKTGSESAMNGPTTECTTNLNELFCSREEEETPPYFQPLQLIRHPPNSLFSCPLSSIPQMHLIYFHIMLFLPIFLLFVSLTFNFSSFASTRGRVIYHVSSVCNCILDRSSSSSSQI